MRSGEASKSIVNPMNQILIGWSFIEVKKSYSVSNDPVSVCDYYLFNLGGRNTKMESKLPVEKLRIAIAARAY